MSRAVAGLCVNAAFARSFDAQARGGLECGLGQAAGSCGFDGVLGGWGTRGAGPFGTRERAV